MAEVDFDTKNPSQFLVMPEQDIVVRCHASPFRVAGFDSEARRGYIGKGQAQYLLQKSNA